MEIPSNHDVRASARYGGSVAHVVRRTTDPQLVWVQTSAREPARRADTDAIERLSPRYFVVTEYCRDVPTSFRLVNFAQVIPGPQDLRHRGAHRSFGAPVAMSACENLRMLRITLEPRELHGVTALRLEGRLTDPCVDELALACQQAMDGTAASSLGVDMTGVRVVDAEGVRRLRALTAGHATRVNCSACVSEQLKEAGDGHS